LRQATLWWISPPAPPKTRPADTPWSAGYGIGNSGTAFIVQAFIVSNMDLTLSTKPGLEDRQTHRWCSNAVISAAENPVVYEIRGDTAAMPDELWSYGVASGQSTKLADIPLGTHLGISQFQASNQDRVRSREED
jgi:hypothetical protein